jgi:hypothetical protein
MKKPRSWIMWALYSLDSLEMQVYDTRLEAREDKKMNEKHFGERFRIKKVRVEEI